MGVGHFDLNSTLSICVSLNKVFYYALVYSSREWE